MDEWSLYDEVNVIDLWPEPEKSNLSSTKWLERKESLEALLVLIEKNPRLTPTTSLYGEIMDELRKIISKDSNINVVLAALKVLTGLAKGLRTKFAVFISLLFSFVLDKAKDKKQNVREAVGATLDAMAASCEPDKITNYLAEHLVKPSPQSKETILLFLYRYFITLSSPPIGFLKTILPIVVKLASDSDPSVREAACASLGSAKRLLGDAIATFIVPINTDKAKLDKIDENLKKAEGERIQFEAAKGVVNAAGGNTSSESQEVAATDGTVEVKLNIAADPWAFKDPVDICLQLSKTWAQEIADTKWQVRKEAVENLLTQLSPEPRLVFSPELKEIIGTLLKVLEKDLNINVGSLAAKSLNGIAAGLRTEYGSYAPKTIQVSLEKLKEKKEVLRKELISLVDTTSFTVCLTNYTENASNGLKNKNPQSRSQSCQFLCRLFARHDANTLPIEAVKSLIPDIEKCSSDGDSEVRESAFKCIAALWKCMGENICLKLFPSINETKIKLDKVSSFIPGLTEEFGTVASPEIARLYKNITKPKPKGSAAPVARPQPLPQTRKPVATVRPSVNRVAPAPVVKKAPVRVVPSANPPPSRPVVSTVRQPIRPQTANVAPITRPSPIRPQTTSSTAQRTSISSRTPNVVSRPSSRIGQRSVTPVQKPASPAKLPTPTSTSRIPSLSGSKIPGIRPPTSTARPPSTSSKLPGFSSQNK